MSDQTSGSPVNGDPFGQATEIHKMENDHLLTLLGHVARGQQLPSCDDTPSTKASANWSPDSPFSTSSSSAVGQIYYDDPGVRACVGECSNVWRALTAEIRQNHDVAEGLLAELREVQLRSERQFAESADLMHRLTSARSSLGGQIRAASQENIDLRALLLHEQCENTQLSHNMEEEYNASKALQSILERELEAASENLSTFAGQQVPMDCERDHIELEGVMEEVGGLRGALSKTERRCLIAAESEQEAVSQLAAAELDRTFFNNLAGFEKNFSHVQGRIEELREEFRELKISEQELINEVHNLKVRLKADTQQNETIQAHLLSGRRIWRRRSP